MLKLSALDVFGLNVVQATRNPNEIFRDFPQSFQADARIVTRSKEILHPTEVLPAYSSPSSCRLIPPYVTYSSSRIINTLLLLM
jgi:hypothetical protein